MKGLMGGKPQGRKQMENEGGGTIVCEELWEVEEK